MTWINIAVRVPGVWRKTVVRRADSLSVGGRTSDPTFVTNLVDVLRSPQRSSGPRRLRRSIHDWARFSKKWCLQTPTSRWWTPGDRTTLRQMMPTCLVPHLHRKPDARRRPTALAASATAEEAEGKSRPSDHQVGGRTFIQQNSKFCQPFIFQNPPPIIHHVF